MKRRRPVPSIYVVVSADGYLCNFADSEEVASDMCEGECEHGHDEPHRVYRYSRRRLCRKPKEES